RRVERLEDRVRGERRGDEARLARHLAEAGRLEEAADALLDAARTHKEAAEFEQALSRLDRHATILDEHDLPDAGRRRAREKLERIGIWKGRGRQRRALDEAESLRPRAEEQGWDDLLVEIYRTLAVGQLYGGDAAEARRWLHSCRELAEATDNARELGYADRYEASVELQEGEPERALELLDRAEDHFRRAGDEARVATVYEKVGYVHMQTDRLERATGRIRKSLDILRNSDVHRPIRIASALNALGDAHRLRGRHGRALEYYREARAIFERADMRSYAATVELNAGLCSMARGSTDQARRALCSARTDFDRAGAEPKRVIAEIGLIACAAQMEDWQRWRDLYEDVEAWLADRDFADRDAAEAAERAGEATVQYGRPEWAERLYRLAAEQWIELGHDDRRDRVRRRLEKLDTTQSA
ncbi:MAG: tetratricopeptide repeat protein, partial [Bradymonadaceae bacterium]